MEVFFGHLSGHDPTQPCYILHVDMYYCTMYAVSSLLKHFVEIEALCP